MKKLFSFLVFITLIFLAPCAWADVIGNNPNPFGSDYSCQGYVPVRFTFPDGTTEYHVGPVWGANPQDGKMSLYDSDASLNLKTFLYSFGVNEPLGANQFDLHSVYMHLGSGYSMIDTTGCDKGIGLRANYGTGDQARYMPQSMIANYLENTMIWDYNSPPDVPPPGDPSAPPGWKVVMRFASPDMVAQSINPGSTTIQIGDQCQATATFYNDYPLAVQTNVKLYHRSNGVDTLIASSTLLFGAYGQQNLYGNYTAVGSSDEALIAVVDDNWSMDLTTVGMHVTQERDTTNNRVQVNIAAGQPPQPPQPPGGGGASNLVADSVTYDTNQQIATAKFHSTFPVGGTVTTRYFSNSMAGGTSITQVGDPQVMHIDANGSIQATDLFFISNGATLYATIDLTYDGTNWNGSKFASSTGAQDETTYEDNKTSCVIGNPPVTPPPTPAVSDEIHPASYHPVVQVPVYTTVTYQEYVPNWVSVPFYQDIPKVKIRVYLKS